MTIPPPLADQPHAATPQASTPARVVGCFLVLAIVCLFAIAAWLSPAPQGLGTHRQLGLPPCTTRVLFGIRCPMCGMTTAWSYAVRGHVFAAATSNLGGLLLAIYTAGWLELARRMIRAGTWPPRRALNYATIALATILIVTLTDWWLRLM